MLLLVLVEGCSNLCHKLDHALCDITLTIHNDSGVSLIGFFNVHLRVCAKRFRSFLSFFTDKVVLLIVTVE